MKTPSFAVGISMRTLGMLGLCLLASPEILAQQTPTPPTPPGAPPAQAAPPLDPAKAAEGKAKYRSDLRSLYLQDAAEKAKEPEKKLTPDKVKTLRAPAPRAMRLMNTAESIFSPTAPQILPSLKPTVIKSKNGRLDAELLIHYNDPKAPNPLMIGKDRVKLRTYNGQLVGPVLRAKAGDTLYITLKNQLGPEPPPGSAGHFENGPHDWNTTNLHFHGLHVAPQGDTEGESDNVLLTIPPGGMQKYAVKIPADHPAGTFWYHSHHHGSTAAQVASGMAGALIIERDGDEHNLDSIPEIAAAAQEIMVLQAVPYLKKDNKDPNELGMIERSPDGKGGNENAMLGPGNWPKMGRYVTVNGIKIPTITVAPGEVRRLRFVMTGQREPMLLSIKKKGTEGDAKPVILPFYEIALDGLATGRMRELPEVEMQPGYRLDALIQPPTGSEGEYYLVDGNAGKGPAADGSEEPIRYVAKFVVTGTPVTMNLPKESALKAQRLTDIDPASAAPTPRYAFYSINTSKGTGFYISRDPVAVGTAPDGYEYDPSPTKVRELTLGATEKWIVGSRNSGTIPAAHPFHIHINPFLITDVRDAAGKEVLNEEMGGSVWRDTLAMKQGYTYTLLTRYEVYTGDFVTHCHILDHEDNGMMERVSIVKPPGAPIALNAIPSFAPGAGNEVAGANKISTTVPEPNGNPSVLFFVEGSLCQHCMAQLSEVAAKLPSDRVEITVVSASTLDDLKKFPSMPYRLVADPKGELSKKFGAFQNKPKHATIVRDGRGKEYLRKVGDQPFMDAAALLGAVAAAGPRAVIAVRETDATTDDYVTWAPTPCTIRVENGTPGAPDLQVALTNDDAGTVPDGGDVFFAASLVPGQTPALNTISLKLKQDGTPLKFWIAGAKKSTLTDASLANAGRDAVFEARDTSPAANLLGQAAVMVRVRKNIDTLNDLEITKVMEAINDLHRVENRYEWYVRLHRLATGHSQKFGDPAGMFWPDQAHRGPAFIAWHRAFLLQFERELQKKFPYVALPYWAQGVTQKFFDPKKFGGPSATPFDTEVAFDPTSPLYGWSMDTLLHDPGSNEIMGKLRRNQADFNQPEPSYQQWGAKLQGKPNFKDAMPNVWQFFPSLEVKQPNPNPYNVERNPHNNGHGIVGPPGIWMSNCRESNADPIFWVFHSNHDYLWAKWQHYHNRFLRDGSDAAHYWPNDAFKDAGADQSVPLGHHLNDTMWPWDGTVGQQVANVVTSNRPNSNGFGLYPAAPFANQWPTAPAMPKPADVIDYLGMNAGGQDLGFCYDDVPYGFRKVSTLLLMEAAPSDALFPARVFMDAQASAELRQSAVPQLLRNPTQLKSADLLGLLRQKETTATLRASSFELLALVAPESAFSEAVTLLGDPATPPTVAAKALAELGRSLHFSSLPHADMEKGLEVLRKLLGSTGPGEIKAGALRLLAPSADAAGKAALIAALENPAASPLSLPETLSLLRFYPDQKARLRGFLTSPNDDAVVAALQSLHGDNDSLDARRQLARDRSRSTAIRRAAIQSLINAASDADLDGLLQISATASEDLTLRAEALASAKVSLQRRAKALPPEAKAAWADKVGKVPAGDITSGDLGKLKAQTLGILTK